jgi:hypothetical protein
VTERLAGAGLFAIIPTWMEGDVIAATVRNALTQGCERVLVVDNASPDDTVAQAVAAGAELASSYETAALDEPLKGRIMNETVAAVSAADGRDHVWWLWLDADEFVHGPGGLTIRQFVDRLDRRFRIVGTRYFNHFPSDRPAMVPGYHPLDLQPLCEEATASYCPGRHTKHHLQRWDRAGPTLRADSGFHRVRCTELLLEPPVATFTHHFPYRCDEVTRARLDRLCALDEGGHARVETYDEAMRIHGRRQSGMVRRRLSLDHVYAGEWAQVHNMGHRDGRVGVQPLPWAGQVDPVDVLSARWYTPTELDDARVASRAGDASRTGTPVRRA